MRTSITVDPTWTRSPVLSATVPTICSPFTNVPLIDPRSRTVSPAPAGEKAAWRREICGVAVEDHVGGAGVAADDDLLADGHFAAGSLTRDEGDRRQRGDLSGALVRRGRWSLLLRAHWAILTDLEVDGSNTLDTRAMAILRITSRPDGEIVKCDRELVIGRGDADVVVDDAEISGRHAVVRPLPDGIEVEDLGSLNGTFVDGERITVPTELRPGATLTLGVTSFALEVGPPSDAPALSARDDTAVREVPRRRRPPRPAPGWTAGRWATGRWATGRGAAGDGAADPHADEDPPGRRLLPLLARLPREPVVPRCCCCRC